MDYEKKIRDCLALAESPNEHEARAALLKARELMAKYKVSEESLQEPGENVARKNTGIDYSLRRDPWVSILANVIAKNHCCRCVQTRQKGKQISEICFVGFSNDVEICSQVFIYAVDCVRSVTKGLRKKYGVKAADGYGFGFTVGLDEAYTKQEKEKGWGLVLVVPEAVDKLLSGIRRVSGRNYDDKLKRSDAGAFRNGIRDGHKFKETKRIGGKHGKENSETT